MKIQIMGDAFVLTSEITTEAIKALAKANPAALKIVDKETKAQKFGISFNEGKSSITDFGITFGGTTRDEDKKATATGTLPAGVQDAKAYVAELIGATTVGYLKQLEETVPVEAKRVADERQSLIDSISVH